MFKIGQKVEFKFERCACVGGGASTSIGTVVNIITNNNERWYQISTWSGFKTVKEQNIIRKIDE